MTKFLIADVGDLNGSMVEELCNQFLSIDYNENNPTPPMSIYLDWKNAKPDMVCLKQRFEVSLVVKYLSELDRLKYIFEKLGLMHVEKEIGSEDWGRLNIPYNEIVKLSPFCNRNYAMARDSSYGTSSSVQLQKIKILCAQYLGHTWEVRQDNSQPYSAEELKAKEAVVCQLYYSNNTQEAQMILSANQDLLNKNRTPWSILILKAIAVILTLPISLPTLLIYSSVKRGSCNFFKPDSQLLSDKLSLELSYGLNKKT